jgi:hypothetical protein
MDPTTGGAAAEALWAARNCAEAERLARRELRHAQPRRRIVTAAGVGVDDLSEHGRRILGWLVDWDEPPIEGVVELVAGTRAAAADTHSGDQP